MVARHVILVITLLLFSWDEPGHAQTKSPTLFTLRPVSQTGVGFQNTIYESDTINILNQANIYNGGGVGIADFNKDGMADIYFSANMESNKLYLNKGALQFEDITKTAGVTGEGRWCTGVSIVDINADGWLDIYVSASFNTDAVRRTNLLYINQGNNKDGIPIFKEEAAAYGIADTGYSTQGYFFDYDKDGDLDLYLVTNQLNDPKTPIKFRPKVIDGSALNTDRLYRNNGNKTFTNVSRKAGILMEGWGHAACIFDFNMDGWPDVYVANDFVANDLLYINNKDGTFTNRLSAFFKHTGWYAMGSDAVDINNDGMVDLVSLEMLPEGNMRKKRMLSGNEYYNYTNAANFGYQHQYVRNVLQLNSGITHEGRPVYSDVGFMAGMYETDWSWCPLVADFDNDGLRDLVITNGLPRDVTDLDYISYDNGQVGNTGNFSLALADSLPVVKIAKYSFKNTGNAAFENTSAAWGFTHPAFSNGAAYSDLDNDGDLDIVINNINETAFLYENTSHHSNEHWLTVTFTGRGANTQGIGANIRLYYGHQQQYYEHQPTRGNGKFTVTPMPAEAQRAPVYRMIAEDVDRDGNLDILMVGNDYGMEPYSGRHDAFNGLWLKGDGRGGFKAVSITESSFFVKGDAKGLTIVHTAKNEDLLIATQNGDSLLVFARSAENNTGNFRWINLQPGDVFADIIYQNGKKEERNFIMDLPIYSQSSRKMKVDKEVKNNDYKF